MSRVRTRSGRALGLFGNKTQRIAEASALRTNSQSAARWWRVTSRILIGIVQMIDIPGGDSTTTCCRSARRLEQGFRCVIVWSALLALLASLCLSSASAETTYGEEAATRLQLASRTEPLTDDAAFGEKIGLFNGTTSFRYVDVSLPSNNSLPVEFARIEGGEYNPNFWAWDVDVPKITSVMPVNWTQGWTDDLPPTVRNDRNVEFLRADYWNGFRLRVDGDSTPLLYRNNDPRIPLAPAGKVFTFMTKSGWLLEVVPAASGVGKTVVGHQSTQVKNQISNYQK